MKEQLRKILFGDIPVREYCTVTVDGDIREKVFLFMGLKPLDVSAIHWLLCLNPIVFGVWFKAEGEVLPAQENDPCELHFMDQAVEGKTVAILKMRVRDRIQAPEGTLVLMELREANVHHIPLHQIAFTLL